MLHTYNVKRITPNVSTLSVYKGTDDDAAIRIYCLYVNQASPSEFIELYKDSRLYRSTIGRRIA
jgi:hypothetical protein